MQNALKFIVKVFYHLLCPIMLMFILENLFKIDVEWAIGSYFYAWLVCAFLQIPAPGFKAKGK